ncbi:MAG: hypothetical protein ACREVZ_04710 [Burkholderiales bacterium]
MKHLKNDCVRGDDKPMPVSSVPTQGSFDKSLAGEAGRADLKKGYTDGGKIGGVTKSDAPDFA